MGVLIHHNYSAFERPNDNHLTRLAHAVLDQEKEQPGDINIIFTNNDEILELNRKYLNHDYYTDVIAFHYGPSMEVEGDVFISLDKVQENARWYEADFEDELLRVTIHGLLHLIGYRDQTEEEKEFMHSLEDKYIDYYRQHFR
ncbi:MAG: rRNA maturation RNase YbeY [Bacteroidales bacterium]|nr:rRNA maturation RNase YbeY [Bacteroidales bacterium]